MWWIPEPRNPQYSSKFHFYNFLEYCATYFPESEKALAEIYFLHKFIRTGHAKFRSKPILSADSWIANKLLSKFTSTFETPHVIPHKTTAGDLFVWPFLGAFNNS